MKKEIQYIEKQITEYPIGVGDFLIVGSDLCLIAQTGLGKIQLITISSSDANRKNSQVVEWDEKGSSYGSLSRSVLRDLTDGEEYRLVEAKLIISSI